MASPRRGSGAVDFCGGSIERTNGMKNMPWLPPPAVTDTRLLESPEGTVAYLLLAVLGVRWKGKSSSYGQKRLAKSEVGQQQRCARAGAAAP